MAAREQGVLLDVLEDATRREQGVLVFIKKNCRFEKIPTRFSFFHKECCVYKSYMKRTRWRDEYNNLWNGLTNGFVVEMERWYWFVSFSYIKLVSYNWKCVNGVVKFEILMSVLRRCV